MRSRTSSSKLFLELFRKQIWVFALSCFGYFMIGPVLFLMRIGEWEAGSMYAVTLSRAEMAERFLQIIRPESDDGSKLILLFILGTLALGVTAAWNGFSYLHAGSKVDLYHALPVKREKLFLIHVLIGAVDYIIPALLWFALSCAVAGVKNIFTLQTAAALACNWFLGLIFCLYAFSIAALAMMLTGRLLTGILGTAVFFFLDIVVGEIVLGIESIFYNTMIGVHGDLLLGIGPKVLSPLHLAVEAFYTWYHGHGWIMALTAGAAAVVLLALSLFIYRKRPSEAAGKSMAFFGAGECIKVILSATAALAFGLIFGEATGQTSDLWMIFGLLLGYAFTYALIQMICTLDIRRCFSGKAAFLAGLVITFGIVALCRFDLTGFDSYLPEQDKIDTIAISVDNQVSCMYDSNMYDTVRMEHAQMPCDDETYAVLERFVSGNMIYHKTGRSSEGEEAVWMQVQVHLKNGKTYQRGYTMYRKDVEQELLTLYTKKEYQEATWPMLSAGEDKLLGMKVFCNEQLISDDEYYENGTEGIVLNKEDARKIFAALKEDFASGDPSVFLREMPFALVQCQMDLSEAGFGEEPSWQDGAYGWADSGQRIWTSTVSVYPSFTNTKKALKALGIEPVKAPDEKSITKIEIWKDDEETGMETITTVTEAEEIRKLLDGLTLSCTVPYTHGGSGLSSWTSPRQMVQLYIQAKDKEIICSGWLK